jgi:hypothetical protein
VSDNPVRDASDAAFVTAREQAGEIVVADMKHAALAVVSAVEGLTLQLRDADNTQFYGLKAVGDKIAAAATDAAAAFAGELATGLEVSQGRRG